MRQASTRDNQEAATPPGVSWWNAVEPEQDQEHPGSGKGSWAAGTEGRSKPLWGKGGGEAKQA